MFDISIVSIGRINIPTNEQNHMQIKVTPFKRLRFKKEIQNLDIPFLHFIIYIISMGNHYIS